jgi:putative cardiolipin synthase
MVAGCATLPTDPPDSLPSYALLSRPDEGFAQVEADVTGNHGPDYSGFVLIDRNEDALRWRLALIDQARYSIDMQYYLWYADASGSLIASRLLAAADRGVRVRLMFDDINAVLGGPESGLALMDEHPNVEIRLFNPWEQRNVVGQAFEYLQRMERLDVRMHNKLLVADNQAVILGGRNIGDHYFGLSDGYNFHDLDVLGIGPVARQASGIFDNFWNSDWVAEAGLLDEEAKLAQLRSAQVDLVERLAESPKLERFSVEPRDWSSEIDALPNRLVVGTSSVLHDSLVNDRVRHTMSFPLRAMYELAEEELLMTNAYVIPTEAGVERLRERSDEGIRIYLLTNSLASHDMALVNSHYGEWRRPLLEAGLNLYEMRPDAAIKAEVADTAPAESEFMGLHTKAMVADRKHVFIGSMNFDPRSVDINTEMGVTIVSPELGERVAALMTRDMLPENSWRLELDETGAVVWVSDEGILEEQPARGGGQRIQNELFKLLPDDLY